MGQSHSARQLKRSPNATVNLSEEFVLQVEKEYGSALKQHPTLRDWPVCITARRGAFRQTMALLMLGANPSSVSLLDGRSCLELAVRAKCSATVFALLDYGASATMEDALLAAMQHDESSMRVIASRINDVDWQRLAASALFADQESEEMVRTL